MKRNWYAVTILAFLTIFLLGCQSYVHKTSQSLQNEVRQAYTQTLKLDYQGARKTLAEAQSHAKQASSILCLVVRRTALERVNETMSVLSGYANPDNQADLAVEVARACAQIEQMENSFLGVF